MNSNRADIDFVVILSYVELPFTNYTLHRQILHEIFLHNFSSISHRENSCENAKEQLWNMFICFTKDFAH